MNILYVIADTVKEYNSARWRCDMPMAAINRTEQHAARKVFIKDWVEGDADQDSYWADIIVLQRNMVAGALYATALWQARGKTLIVDVDDGYEYMPQTNQSAAFWINNQHGEEVVVKPADPLSLRPASTKHKLTDLEFSPLEHLILGMKIAHGVTTPSKVIVNDRLPLNPCTALLPNYPDTEFYRDALTRKKPREDGQIVIGWGGGGSHLQSFLDSGIMTAFGNVLRQRKNARILIMGPRDVFNKLRRAYLPYQDRMDNEPWNDYVIWPDRLARIDIGVAPLVGNYDLRRSWLKGIEYTVMGIPWYGTDYGKNPQPYGDFADHHLIRNNATRWTEALLYTFDHLDEAKAAAKHEQEWALQFDLYRNADNIIRVYEDLARQEVA